MTSGSLQRRTSPEQSAMVRRGLLVPVGSFEQHGPHLPMSTDSLIATVLCEDVAGLRNVDVAPTFAYGASGEHAGFSGLLSLGTDATASALTELVRSARDTWSYVVIVSGHGGNLDALERVRATANADGDRLGVWLARDEHGDPHAGATETSVVLTIDPTLVHLDRLGVSEPLGADWSARARAGGVRAVSSTGVLGDPHAASAEMGWTLRRRWCAEVVAMIDQLECA